MKIYNNIELLPLTESFVMTIGNFDGVHLGHKHLISNLKSIAKKNSSKTVVMTFRPHPMVILNNISEKFLLTDSDERNALINLEGIDYLLEIPFTRDVSTLKPHEFLENYIFKNNNISVLLLGFNFFFGSQKSGTYEVVKEFIQNKKIKTEVLKASGFTMENEVVSSSKIRHELSQGNVSLATKYLGRNFQVTGVVVKGDGVGRTIGFPTANIKIPVERCIPKNGVYVTKTQIKNKEYFSLTNIGHRPTFVDESPLKFETHILDFNDNIYGEEIIVSFYEVIRSEKKFSSVSDLIDQINMDKNFSQSYWSGTKKNS